MFCCMCVVLGMLGHQQVLFHSVLTLFLDSGRMYVYERQKRQGLSTSSM